jgi:PAS domain S-box-containing protein
MIFRELLNNMAWLLTLSILYSMISRLWVGRGLTGLILTGCLFGGVAVGVMLNPMHLLPGLVFDTRSVVISLAGLFGGPLPAALSALIAMTYRVWQGGIGAWPGVLVISSSALLGVVWYYWRKRRPQLTKPYHLYGFGLLVHVVMLLCMLSLPWSMARQTLSSISFPVMVIYPVATMLLGLLLSDQENRRRAVEELRVREQTWQDILNYSPAMIYIKDRKHRYLLTNRQHRELLGLTAAQLLGRAPAEVYPPEVVAELNANDVKVLESGQAMEVEETVATANGPRQYRSIKFPLKNMDGSIYGVCGISTDITDREKAAQALAASEEKYRLVVEHASEAIVVAQDGRLKFFNQKTLELADRPAEELQDLSFLELLHPDDRPLVTERYLKRLRGEEAPAGYSFRVIDKKGVVKWVELHAVVINWKGRPATLNFLSDITDRIKSEIRIKAALQEKEVLLREIHHRVKNNMQVVASLLNLQVAAEKNEQVVEALRESQSRVGTMALVHEALYRSESMADIHLDQYVSSLVSRLLALYSPVNSRIQTVVEMAPELTVSIDQAVPCGLVLNELISNAIKYAFDQPTGGRITVTGRMTETGQLELTVADNGVGIPEGVEQAKGQTLGLSLVYSLVEEQLEGTVEIIRGGGTTFRLTFKI